MRAVRLANETNSECLGLYNKPKRIFSLDQLYGSSKVSITLTLDVFISVKWVILTGSLST